MPLSFVQVQAVGPYVDWGRRLRGSKGLPRAAQVPNGSSSSSLPSRPARPPPEDMNEQSQATQGLVINLRGHERHRAYCVVFGISSGVARARHPSQYFKYVAVSVQYGSNRGTGVGRPHTSSTCRGVVLRTPSGGAWAVPGKASSRRPDRRSIGLLSWGACVVLASVIRMI